MIFEEHDVRYKVNGHELRDARLERSLTLQRFAFLCGWSFSYQWQLENGYVSTVCKDVKTIIEEVLTKEYKNGN